jgi:hypothetical protein
MLGISPEEFGKMTLREFYIAFQGYGWTQLVEARGRANIIAAIGNYSGNLPRGRTLRAEKLCPIQDAPANIFFRQMFNLPH